MVIGGIIMSRKGENIYHRKDGRWEGRYIKLRSPHQKTVYGYVYANSYTAVKEKLLKARLTVQDNKCNKENKYIDKTRPPPTAD